MILCSIKSICRSHRNNIQRIKEHIYFLNNKIISNYKNDISSKMESFETKISDLSKKLEPVNEIQSPVFIDNITNEAIDRIK